MEKENYLLISLDDEKSKTIAEVIGSKTCKKIINYLSETKEASQKDLSIELKIPLNTVEYNIKKLLDAGFIRKTKNFFWSKKGKKIIMYELSKKSVVISQDKKISNKIKSILPAFILTAAGTFAIWTYEKVLSVPQTLQQNFAGEDMVYGIEKSISAVSPQISNLSQTTPLWIWFLFGSLIAITIISIINWRKL